MSELIRLIAMPVSTTGGIKFQVAFAAQASETFPDGAAGALSTGDGQAYTLGQLCPPTAVTWREQRLADLVTHTYKGAGPYIAVLTWGVQQVQAQVHLLPQIRELPQPTAIAQVALFNVVPVTGQPFQRLVKLRVEGLATGHSLRLDAGAGQVHNLTNESGASQAVELALDYAKPGSYTVTLDLLDAGGFWLATLAETPLDISFPEETQTGAVAPAFVQPSSATEATASTAATAAPPWLPYRYVRPTHSAYTYTTPGGSTIRRTVNTSYYLTARAETVVGGKRWFQTALGDWIAADVVAAMTPSDFQGIALDTTLPPPPTGTRRGIVTADALNVRAAPGVSAGNPPIATLRAGAEVTIYEERMVAGATWYRIGENRWVHSAYVRIVSETPPPPIPATRRGIVTADVLNVRAAPGASASNPPIATLRAGAEVIIYEERTVSGGLWYRIGENRWVAGSWVRVLEANVTRSPLAVVPVSAPTALPLGWVVANTLNVRAQPGVAASNPPIGQLGHYARVAILEQSSVSGVRWFRIGDNQWIEGRQVGVARTKIRPTSIGAGTRWVGVCLSEQTFVAYEGDKPVFTGLTASGLPGTPTVQGIFRTWQRLETGKMSGPGYYIEDVTWTCYFYSGYALHTAYWHDSFGTTRSHGCVNLSPHDAWWIYQWSAAGGANSPTVYVYWA